eukprot:CAMPEP_0114230666 /NCGR_PEP_ID=MMETSP0058-20121206/3598_1 /TAXON_ID=36894 /ORGANISM="Pyramimonas parkeae, CCMP726" /LENGTH=391 /DNA_ID=CAMNT_0001341895 /DNA_START=151 /DNA_END=1326 /DNA_ORIENTATION=-
MAALTKSLDRGMDSLDLFTAKGRMPGYLGHVPGMRNHVIGRRYADATVRAGDAADMMRHGVNPSGTASLVDDRPQGRHYLYAQIAEGVRDEPKLAPPHVGKRKPLLNHATTGQIDPRLMPKVVGSLGEDRGPMKTIKCASLPTLPYGNKRFLTRKEYPEAPPTDVRGSASKLPGYTGHQASSQHMFAQSYGRITQALNQDAGLSPAQLAKQFIHFGEERPVGDSLDLHHAVVPGYQGHVPGKDNYVYGKTFGASAVLASEANSVLQTGKSPSVLASLVDHRPTGRVDLYAESHIQHKQADPTPLLMHLGKGVAQPNFREVTADYKIRERYEDDVKEVQTGKHHVVGYTGHVRGEQHVYSQGYGKMTRMLHGADQGIHDRLLDFEDDRPHRK